MGASGAIVTTLPDLLRWGGRGDRPTDRPSPAATPGGARRAGHQRAGVRPLRPGIGELKGWWGHTGEGFGFQAATFYDPVTRSVIAVALNSSQPENVATQIFKALADVVRPR